MTKKEDHQKEVRQEKDEARAAAKEEKRIKEANDDFDESNKLMDNPYPTVVPSDSMLEPPPPMPKQVAEIEFKLAQVRNDGVAIFRQVNKDTTGDSFTIAEVLVKRTLLPDPVDYKRTLKVTVEL